MMNNVQNTPIAKPAKEVTITLDLPIEREGVQSISTIILKRLKHRHIKQLTVLFGAEIIEFLTSGEKIDVQKQLQNASSLINLLSEEKLSKFEEVLSDIMNISADDIGEIDPYDYPKFWDAFTVFFPNLMANQETK